MGVVSRWAAAVAGSLVCFGVCWAGLALGRVWDPGTQVGVAAVPLVVALAVLGAWAEGARERGKKVGGETAPPVNAEVWQSAQGQAIGQAGDGSLIFGPGTSITNSVFNLSETMGRGQDPLRERADGPPAVLIVGDVPQEPPAFQSRPGLAAALESGGGSRVSVVFAVTGIRGVGKTQVAAAYARRRIGDGWRLVAWVDASDEASVLMALAQVAVAARVGSPGDDARVLAAKVRHWLEADGERRLIVFDNTVDLDALRPFVPAAGAAQVVITSSRTSAAGLGRPVVVDVFTEDEALAFLRERTGLEDEAGARELTRELGALPLGLAQAASLIAREHLSYGTYLERLRALPVADYLRRADGDSYPYRLAEAIVLSLRAAEAHDPSGWCAALMGLIAVLAETGVPRRVLHLATSTATAGGGQPGAEEVDAATGVLADASLVGFTRDDSVVAHRLVMRVARERLAFEGGLPAVLASAVRVLAELAGGIDEAELVKFYV